MMINSDRPSRLHSGHIVDTLDTYKNILNPFEVTKGVYDKEHRTQIKVL